MTTILSRVAELPNLSAKELRAAWTDLFGTPPAPYNRRALEDRLAYRIQELAFGGLSTQTIKRLEALGEQLDGGKAPVRHVRSDRIPVPGTRLVRQWKGVEHTVIVTREGFDYLGQPYKSLSPIAKRVTGKSWNGFVFFGLKTQGSSK